ncbi:hypothetical protein B0H11DRAFT_2197433 [Mycena galericulata]|nr:hypothetical protein B0H11DRAFT_2197433 [Mycena galericulata]
MSKDPEVSDGASPYLGSEQCQRSASSLRYTRTTIPNLRRAHPRALGNIYLRNGTFHVVTPEPSSSPLPPFKQIAKLLPKSGGWRTSTWCTDEVIQPLEFINPQEASFLFGGSIYRPLFLSSCSALCFPSPSPSLSLSLRLRLRLPAASSLPAGMDGRCEVRFLAPGIEQAGPRGAGHPGPRTPVVLDRVVLVDRKARVHVRSHVAHGDCGRQSAGRLPLAHVRASLFVAEFTWLGLVPARVSVARPIVTSISVLSRDRPGAPADLTEADCLSIYMYLALIEARRSILVHGNDGNNSLTSVGDCRDFRTTRRDNISQEHAYGHCG